MTHSLKRIQGNMLAVQERRLLTWLCAHMPPWITPDVLTVIGLVGAALTGIGYAASNADPLWLVATIIGYVVQWFGDSMDGSLARFRNIERPSFGYFIDHSCDGIAIFVIMVGMGVSPYVTMSVALFALTGYLLLAIHTFLAAYVVREFRLSHLGMGPTELRIFLIILSSAMLVARGNYWLSYFDIFVGGCAMILILLFIKQTWALGRDLAVLSS